MRLGLPIIPGEVPKDTALPQFLTIEVFLVPNTHCVQFSFHHLFIFLILSMRVA